MTDAATDSSTTDSSTTVKATEIEVGDRIRARGLELTVSRIDHPFMGRASMIAFVEDTDVQWLKMPVRVDAEVERLPR